MTLAYSANGAAACTVAGSGNAFQMSYTSGKDTTCIVRIRVDSITGLVKQPGHGMVSYQGNAVTYVAGPGFVGTDEFVVGGTTGGRKPIVYTIDVDIHK